MRRPVLPLTLAVLLLAASSLLPARGAEQPGLEVFDAGFTTGGNDAGQGFQPDPFGPTDPVVPVPNPPPVIVPQGGVVPDPYEQLPLQPAATPGDSAPVIPYEAPLQTDPTIEPYGDQPSEPVAAQPAPPETAQPAAPPYSALYPPDPVAATLEDLNITNRDFPGLADAAASGSMQSVGAVVWETLKARRIIAATMARGPGATAGGQINPYEMQRIIDIATIVTPDAATGQDAPAMAASRIDAILDSFDQPLVADPAYGSYMGQILVRLHSDIIAVRNALEEVVDESVYLELTRAYFRAVTTCDFFIFPKTALASDVNEVFNRAAGYFYPDGASIAGDVAGVTGNLFQSLLAIDFYTRDDHRYRRDLRTAWRNMETPARYALDLALPDMTMPHIGPRGMRELTPEEVMRLNEIFPKRPPSLRRIGLAASHSFPASSNTPSYGGIFVTRSGYDSTARYLSVRFGPLGCVPGIPSHRDFGSLVLMSRNIKFIVDGGGFGGEAALPGAHSNLSLGGQNVTDASYNQAGKVVPTLWRTNASLDYVTDMAAFADGKTWQRSLVYLKDLPGEDKTDYWLVLDKVDMQNDPQPYQAEIRFQLAPGIQAYNDGSGIVATPSYVDGSALRFFPINASSQMTVSDGAVGLSPSYVYTPAGGQYAAPAVVVTRTLTGDTTTATLLYPAANLSHRPARIERDADIISGRTGAVVVDHGHGRIDVIAWAPPGTELVTPTLNLQMSADLGVFRLRDGKLVRMNFINLERFQAKEPDGGIWSMRVNGPVQSLTLEPEQGGGWQVLADPANEGGATLYDVNFGPGISQRKFSIRPGEMRVIPR